MRPLKPFLAWLAALPCLAPSASAQVLKLNTPLPRAVVGDVAGARVTPDGARVIYVADGEEDEVFQVFAVPLDGSRAALALSGPMTPGGDVRLDLHGIAAYFALSADGTRVVYVADQDTDEVFELYSVPSDGSASPVRLNAALPPGCDVSDFELSPLTNRVVYRTHPPSQLFSVPLDGSGAAVRLDDALAGTDVSFFMIAPDGQRVVYRAAEDTAGVNELYSVPIDRGAPPVKLSGPMVAGGDVAGPFGFDQEPVLVGPTGGRVAYLADQEVDEVFELYSVPGDGSAPPVRLHAPILIAGGDVIAEDLYLTADGARVVFTGDIRQDGAFELFSAPLDGSALAVRLSNASNTGVGEVESSPDGTRTAFYDGATEGVYAVPTDGSSPPTLLEALTPGTLNTGANFLRFTPDGARLVFIYEGTLSGIHSVPADGSASALVIPVSLTPTLDELTEAFRFTPDGARVVGVASHGPVGSPRYEVVSAAVLGGSVLLLSLPHSWPGGATGAPRLTPDGTRVVHIGDFDEEGVVGLFVAPVDHSSPALRLDPATPDVTVGDVRAAWLVAGGERVVYVADQDTPGRLEVYSALTNGRGAPVKLSPTLSAGQVIQPDVLVSPDGERVVFATWQGFNFARVFVAPVDGSAPALDYGLNCRQVTTSEIASISPDGASVFLLSSSDLFGVPLAGGSAPVPIESVPGTVLDAAFGQGGQRVVFRVSDALGDHVNLFSLDDDLVSVQLNPQLIHFRGVEEYGISSQGWVAYRANQQSDAIYQLYGVPLDRRSAPVPLTSFNVDPDFAIVPGGLRVLARSFGSLYSCRIDGGSPPLQLDRPNEGVADFRASADGASAVYRGAAFGTAEYALVVVPVDGSAPAHGLSGPLVPGGSVQPFVHSPISPDGTRAVYVADQDEDEAFDLYRVPLDHSAPALRLDPRFPGRDVESDFRISAVDQVVFRSDLQRDGFVELYQVPMDGSAPPRRVGGPVVPGGAVVAFELSPDGHLAIYRADQDEDETFELYACVLRTPGHEGAPAPTRQVSRPAQ